MVPFRRFVAPLALAILVFGRGGAPAAEVVDDNDPLEPLNRVVFEINRRVLWYTARPLALTWRRVLPEPVRDGFRNVLDNLDSPLDFGNQILQGDAGAASRTAARLFVNTTFGMGGIVDVGHRLGIPKRDTNLGQTFGLWGVFEGPYIVLPLLGPSTPRETVGSFTQGGADPFNLWAQNTPYAFYAFLARFVFGNIDTYARRIDDLDRIEESSLDFYASLRNLYLQKRRADLTRVRADAAAVPPGIDYGLDYGLDVDAPDDERLDEEAPDEEPAP